MKQNNAVLQKMGIVDKVVKDWKSKGLKITFPMNKNKKYFRSDDGPVFVESADKYAPHLSKKETELYIRNPIKFEEDFLRNVTFYFNFHTFLFDKSGQIERLSKSEERLAASLALMYLFQSAMDHHYYHFDRYLVYQDYPETPVGYWWKKLKDYYIKAFREKVTKQSQSANYLRVLARDPKILKELKKRLSKEEFIEFKKVLDVIKLFEGIQQKEYKIISGYPSKEDLLLKSGFSLWNNIYQVIKKYPTIILRKYRKKILKLIEGHPITSTRELLLTQQLKSFKKEIFMAFKEELARWL